LTLEMFEALQQQDVVLNVITYSAVISACEKSKESKQAFQVFEAM